MILVGQWNSFESNRYLTLWGKWPVFVIQYSLKKNGERSGVVSRISIGILQSNGIDNFCLRIL